MEQSIRPTWFEAWVEPLAAATLQRDNIAFHQARQRLLDAQLDGSVDEATAAALGYALAYYKYAHYDLTGSQLEQVLTFNEAVAVLAQPAHCEIDSLARRRYLLLTRLRGHTAGLADLPVAELETLLADLPPADRTAEHWLALGVYYCRRGDRAGLDRLAAAVQDQGAELREQLLPCLDLLGQLGAGQAPEAAAGMLILNETGPCSLRLAKEELRRLVFASGDRAGDQPG
ncbi:hypothetical protein JW859_09105 [bacterium]|nr:hypothetical protein [bacterium]